MKILFAIALVLFAAPAFAQSTQVSNPVTDPVHTCIVVDGACADLTTESTLAVSATTSYGWTTSFTAAAASTNATSVKASAGNVYLIRLSNTSMTVYYLRMYNLAAAPTCSSATGFVETIPIIASSSQAQVQVNPQAYSTGIAFCITAGPTSTDNTNAATGVFVTIGYK